MKDCLEEVEDLIPVLNRAKSAPKNPKRTKSEGEPKEPNKKGNKKIKVDEKE